MCRGSLGIKVRQMRGLVGFIDRLLSLDPSQFSNIFGQHGDCKCVSLLIFQKYSNSI